MKTTSSSLTPPPPLPLVFQMLPSSLTSIAELPEETLDKNRYANVIPNPRSRVKLLDAPSDYINANYIKVRVIRCTLQSACSARESQEIS